MKKINIIDTALEYRNQKAKIDKAVLNVLKSGIYINGPEVEKFEKNCKFSQRQTLYFLC